ncbi:MAG: AbrB/MazE/SpoVT family DNA-binding domain-containing protein [Opitutaceae bacterium]|jgi:antitoxin MazE|nr:AbrB/MazE/SpoVT family DNA-binding domain-containing protein [Opitutaceae bacterium]
MKASIINIGNSLGIRIPKPILAQCRFESEVELAVSEQGLLISPVKTARAGWETAFSNMAASGDDILEEQPCPTSWDENEWEWK